MSEMEWHEDKRAATLIKHGLDFADADVLFDGRNVLTRSARYEDEERFMTTGMVMGRLCTLIWTWREDRRRCISFRSARDEEKRKYRQLYE